MRTAGNSVLIDCIINIFRMNSWVKRNVSTGKMPDFTKGITNEQVFVKLSRIKSSITEKYVWIDERMFVKEILQGRDKEPGVMDRFVLIR